MLSSAPSSRCWSMSRYVVRRSLHHQRLQQSRISTKATLFRFTTTTTTPTIRAFSTTTTTTTISDRSFSSPAVATATADEDNGDVNDNRTASSSSSSSSSMLRPRLEALRQQLESEAVIGGGTTSSINHHTSSHGSSSSSSSSMVQKTKTKTKPTSNPLPPPSLMPPPSGKGCSSSSSSSSASSTTTKENEDDDALEEIIRHVQTLPDIPTTPILQDRFGRTHNYLRISLSEKCNLRCLYCMPEQGIDLQPQSSMLTNDEILRLVELFIQNGVTKLRLTGGEPLLRKDLYELLEQIQIQFNGSNTLEQIGITTNGISLSRSKLESLISVGLTHVNLSLDSLHPTTFSTLTRRPESYHKKVIDALYHCAELLPYQTKVNVVVMPTNQHELYDFCQLSRELPIDIRFIEYMPFNDNLWDETTSKNGFINYNTMLQTLQNQFVSNHSNDNIVVDQDNFPFVLERLEDGPNDTTKWWGLTSPPSPPSSSTILSSSPPPPSPPKGRIGFITSMSQHFCSTCNRLRLTSDGKLKVCLFGTTEVNLRDLLRRTTSTTSTTTNTKNTKLLEKVIHYAVQQKHYKLGGHSDMQDLAQHSAENRPMTTIGG